MGSSTSSPQGRQRNQHYILIDDHCGSFDKDEEDAVATTSQPTKSAKVIQDHEDDVLANIDDELKDFDFPFENLILEGGGAQGNAYIGAICEMERLGYLSKLRRFGGASIGAFTACCLAVGHGSEKFLSILKGPQINDLLDASLGGCSMVPNFLRHLGWHPGRAIYQFIGDAIAEKLDDPDATFKDLYDKTGRELCVVVTNLSTMMEEYCHVKTTPNMPLRAAIRMSTSIPGVFFPVKRRYMDRTDLYIDGGVLCNYPVHCYDGWWLSMKPEDSFLRRMRPLEDGAKLLTKKERFGMFNDKTFGMIIYSDYDSHVLATNTDLEAPIAPIPDTILARAHEKMKKKRDRDMEQHAKVTEAMTHFLSVLNVNNLDGNATISREEFSRVFKDTNEFTDEDIETLFGKGLTSDKIFESLDVNKDEQIDFHELMVLAEREGVGLQTQHIGSGRQDIFKPADFITGIFTMLLLNVKRAFLEGCDIERTVLINTVYFKSFHFNPEQEDVDFLVEQGRRGFLQFLKYQANKMSSDNQTCSS
ncbi:uncharacterized protein LOC121422059 [Lytechinus variegatus]|uniref:uncharacterized protein LOC121422059 n=1 Tax=Lytechinus variegatus TaxID=7654 RepID=UPI001BB20E34|nr:uncharacterized protein LOC121422059 [Lytechinus variegatus]